MTGAKIAIEDEHDDEGERDHGDLVAPEPAPEQLPGDRATTARSPVLLGEDGFDVLVGMSSVGGCPVLTGQPPGMRAALMIVSPPVIPEIGPSPVARRHVSFP